MKKYFLVVLCSIWCAHAQFSLNENMCRLFNRVTMRHLEGIGFALAHPEKYPDVDVTKGLAAWWERFAVNGGIYAVLGNEEVCALAQELHDIATQDSAFQEALVHARLADSDKLSDEERQVAWYLAGRMYVSALFKEAEQRGCLIKSASPQGECHPRPGSGATCPAIEEQSWGGIAELAKQMQMNAMLDHEKGDQVFSAIALAQLIFRTELEANRLQ